MTSRDDAIRDALLALVPADGGSVGNTKVRREIEARSGLEVSKEDYFRVQQVLVDEGLLVKGPGRGGSVRRTVAADDALELSSQEIPEEAKRATPKQQGLDVLPKRTPGKPTRPKKSEEEANVVAYRHRDTRINNPEVGMVTPDSDDDDRVSRWAYDPHLSPELRFDVGRAQIENLIDEALGSDDVDNMRDALATLKRMAEPYLNWAGKAERTSFEVDLVSLHVHERIDPATVLNGIRKRMQKTAGGGASQSDMFRAWFEESLPYREAIEFYKHERGWANRLIAGDSLLVMNSLLQKEGMEGQVQMIYLDPPYGIKYGSNFQPFTAQKPTSRTDKDQDLTAEPEMIKAFRDTWQLGIHSYLAYLRDRLRLANRLLRREGSLFVQISDDNLHLVRNLVEEVFGRENFVVTVLIKKKGSQKGGKIDPVNDYLVWVAKDRSAMKYNQLYAGRDSDEEVTNDFNSVLMDNGSTTSLAQLEKSDGVRPRSYRTNLALFRDRYPKARIFKQDPSTGGNPGRSQAQLYQYQGIEFDPGIKRGLGWKASADPESKFSGMRRLEASGRLHIGERQIAVRRFPEDFGLKALSNWWDGMGGASSPIYIVQTNERIVERCIQMTTDPGDLVLDPTCGSGTTALSAEKWGRRWITCDTSRVAITLAKQRMLTASFDYFVLRYAQEGLKGGFFYKAVPHIMAARIANNAEIDEIWRRMHPAIESALSRLNEALRDNPAVRWPVTEGGRKGAIVDFTVPTSFTAELPSGEVAPAGALLEWEVPFDFPNAWPEAARVPFDTFHAARRAMQERMDASIAAHADQETLYDQPEIDKDKLRVTGPFTVEAVPFPTVRSLDDAEQVREIDASIARSGESARQHAWRDELLKTHVRGKGGQMLRFAELETLPDMRCLHCVGSLADSGDRVVVSFGPEHAALEQRQVENALREAGELFPRPQMIVFCAFTFDPEAAKDIDATRGITALKVQMNTDLLTEDLKKARTSNESFWLMGQPDVEPRQRKDGMWEVEVHGFDYFDPTKGELVSGGKQKIAAWMLDADYDERSLFPTQVFFPMAGAKDGWNKLKRNIRAELDEDRLSQLHSTVSLPFEAGEHGRVAVKIVDDRGIESLKVIPLPTGSS